MIWFVIWWLVTAAIVAVIIGRGIRLADQRAKRRDIVSPQCDRRDAA